MSESHLLAYTCSKVFTVHNSITTTCPHPPMISNRMTTTRSASIRVDIDRRRRRRHIPPLPLKNVRKGVTNDDDDDDANGGCWKLEYKLTTPTRPTRPTMITNSRDGFKRVAQQQTRLDRQSLVFWWTRRSVHHLASSPPSLRPHDFSFLFSSF